MIWNKWGIHLMFLLSYALSVGEFITCMKLAIIIIAQHYVSNSTAIIFCCCQYII